MLNEDLKLEYVTKKLVDVNSDEAIFKTIFTTICGSDLRIASHGDSRIVGPRVLGHEIVARVVASGSRNDFKPGDVVAIGADIPCGTCDFCKIQKSNLCDVHTAIGYQFDGGFAQYIRYPAKFLSYAPIVKVPDSLDSFCYSLAEPAGCVINGLEFSQVIAENSMAIIGAGPIGIMIAKLAIDYCGVSKQNIVLIEPSITRRNFAENLGFVVYDEISEVIDLNERYDRIFTATSNSDSHKLALNILKKGGILNFFGGIPKSLSKPIIDANTLHYSEFTVGGSHGSTPRQHRIATEIIKNDTAYWKALITAKFSLHGLPDAFFALKEAEEMKVGIFFE